MKFKSTAAPGAVVALGSIRVSLSAKFSAQKHTPSLSKTDTNEASEPTKSDNCTSWKRVSAEI